MVIGGGNVSIDVALTALRQGAQHVDLTAIDQRRDMSASPHDIEMAVGEGVQLHPGWGPIKIDEDGGVTFQLCEQTHDADGKFDPKYDPTRLMTLEADHVIMATGQGTDMAILDGSDVEQYHHGFIVADSKTLMTDEPGVFAGGDAQHGPRLAVDAIRSGKIAAAAIDAWLRGTPMDDDVGKPVRRDDVIPLPVLAQDRTYRPRAVMPERSVEEVLGEGNYVQIEEGLTDTMAHDEVRRCLRCDVCIGCGLCMAACSEMGIDALRMADTTAPRLAYFDFTRVRGVHRLRRVHPGLPDGRDPPRGPRRHAKHDHHRNRREGAAAAHLQRMRSADADARAPRVRPRSTAGPHGRPPRARALPDLRPRARRPSPRGGNTARRGSESIPNSIPELNSERRRHD